MILLTMNKIIFEIKFKNILNVGREKIEFIYDIKYYQKGKINI
jgi:hypothetical protein